MIEIDKNCKVEKACSGEKYQEHLMSPYLDLTVEDKPVLVATDGKILAAIPVEVIDDGSVDESGYVSAEALQAARKVAGVASRRDYAKFYANGNVNVPLAESPEYPRPYREPNGEWSQRFPGWRSVVPAKEESDVVVGIDAKLLSRLAGALGTNGQLVLHIKVERGTTTKAIRVTTFNDPDALGVIMPVKV